MDVEVQAVMTLTGYFMWPVWVRAHARTKKARKEMASLKNTDNIITHKASMTNLIR